MNDPLESVESPEHRDLDPWQTPEGCAREVKKRAEAVDYAKILNGSQILFIGEQHFNLDLQAHLLKHIRSFKKADITYLTFETNAEYRDLFDKLNKKENVDIEEVKTAYPEFTGELDIELARAAVATGIKVVPVDVKVYDLPPPPTPDPEEAYADYSERLNKFLEEYKKQKEVADSIPFREQREASIAGRLIDILNQDPSAKIAARLGWDHTLKTKSEDGNIKTVRARTLEAGFSSVTAVMTGGADLESKVFTEGVKKAGYSNRDFMIDTHPYWRDLASKLPYGVGEIDFIVHTPVNTGVATFLPNFYNSLSK